MNPDPEIPAQFLHDALRGYSGLVELTGWSSVTLTGADSQTFLNNFCTNDVVRLTPGEICETFFCNVKGKVIGQGAITCRDKAFVVVGPPQQAALLTSHLDRYIIREDVSVRESTAERSYLLLVGDPARSTVLAMAPSIDVGNTWLKPQMNAAAKVLDIPVRWIGWDLLDPLFSGLIETQPENMADVQKALHERGALTYGHETFDTLRIEVGLPLLGVDFDDSNFPQEVGRNTQAISFTKGCYLGQETVARIDALGHVNQEIVGVAFSGAQVPDVNMELTHEGRNVGHVTSAAYSPALNRPLALALVRREHNAVGSKLESTVGPCEVVALPVTHRPEGS